MRDGASLFLRGKDFARSGESRTEPGERKEGGCPERLRGGRAIEVVEGNIGRKSGRSKILKAPGGQSGCYHRRGTSHGQHASNHAWNEKRRAIAVCKAEPGNQSGP